MSIKTILLHLTNDSRLDSRIEVALSLATENGAHIRGVYTITPATPPTSFMGYIPPEFVERTRSLEQENSAIASKKLMEVAKKVDVSVKIISEEGYAPDIITKYALTSDIVIVGQVDPDDDKMAQYQYLADELVVACACPVLVVPYAGKYHSFGTHILVGWNNTRESSKAIHGGMTFLKRAEKVTLLSVNPKEDNTEANEAAVAHLKRHGIAAEIKVGHWPNVGVGNALLDALVDYNADMLVMGAYGHSRLREMILGGATQEILGHMTAPVLFTH